MDKEEIEATFRLPAVNEQVQTNHLLGHYMAMYLKKYKVEAVLPDDHSPIYVMSSIQKSAGSRAFALIEHFFKMDPDGWYSKQGHSIQCLKSNINAVNVSLGKTQPKVVHGTVKISTWFSCDGCFKHFWFTCDPSVFGSGVKILCLSCSMKDPD